MPQDLSQAFGKHGKRCKLKGNSRSLREWLHDSQPDLHDVHTQYVHGMLSLTERHRAEELYLNIFSSYSATI